jgi:hypothetical protein
MNVCRVYVEPEEVEDRLAPFGVTGPELFSVVQQVVAARANTIAVDAAIAAGTQAYLAGVRHSRLLLIDKGYELDNTGNVESSVHPITGIKIIYQSVDIACSEKRGPRALHGKGPATNRMIEEAQGMLFSIETLPEVAPPDMENNKSIWFLCVSVDGDDVAAELSRPQAVQNNNFKGFSERIFLVQPGDWDLIDVERLTASPDDYEFDISRKT